MTPNSNLSLIHFNIANTVAYAAAGCENCIKVGTSCPVTSVGYSGAGQDMQIKWICHDNINCLGR